MGAPKESQTEVNAANELYWGSKQSVNKIAEKLELSKSALYDMISPKPLDPEQTSASFPLQLDVSTTRTLAAGALLGAAAGLALVIWTWRK